MCICQLPRFLVSPGKDSSISFRYVHCFKQSENIDPSLFSLVLAVRQGKRIRGTSLRFSSYLLSSLSPQALPLPRLLLSAEHPKKCFKQTSASKQGKLSSQSMGKNTHGKEFFFNWNEFTWHILDVCFQGRWIIDQKFLALHNRLRREPVQVQHFWWWHLIRCNQTSSQIHPTWLQILTKVSKPWIPKEKSTSKEQIFAGLSTLWRYLLSFSSSYRKHVDYKANLGTYQKHLQLIQI